MDIQSKIESLDPQAKQQVEDFIDFLLTRQQNADQLLEASINRGTVQSETGKVRPHEQVMSAIRAKYK